MRMNFAGRLLAVLATFCLLVGQGTANRKPTRNVEITAEQEKLRDPDGFAAIRELHRLMDDDQSGSIDRSESADFLKEDLKIGGGSDRARREKAFHHNNDESITVDDMWESWFESEERDWNAQEVAEWLRSAVRLPQYADNFLKAGVTGMALPRMATQNSSFNVNVLGIKNFVHRQKLQLKALDLVLFGFQDANSRLKDIALAALIILLISVLILFKTHRTRSKRQMAELSSMLSELKSMENDFEGAEQKLDEDRQRHMSVVESEHIEALKCQLLEAERRIEMNGYDSIPFALQPLLRRTYELEWSYIDGQKLECLREMRDAKDFVDKMRRKQSGLLASFKIATGTTIGTEDIDSRIFSLKARMEKIKLSMDECQQRWMDMESLCGFSIAGPFGSSTNVPSGGVTPNAAGGDHNGDVGSVVGRDNGGSAYYDSIHSNPGANGSLAAYGSNSFETGNGSVFSESSGMGSSVANGTHSAFKHQPPVHPANHRLKNPFAHSVSQQQLLLQQQQQHQQPQNHTMAADTASACVALNSTDADSVTLSASTTHLHKIGGKLHRKSLAAGLFSSGGARLSDDSSSLSSTNSKGFGLKKPKKLSNFLRRKLSKA